jgi:DNA-binding response OmpR family regulator
MYTILLIDDDSALREVLGMMLHQAGYAVIPAANGKEGVRLYRERRPDLIITDLIMPEKEGLETIFEVQTEFPKAKIIAMSGGGQLGSTTYLDIASQMGAQKILRKPFSIEELLTAIRDLLKP